MTTAASTTPLSRYLDEGYHRIAGWLHRPAVDVTLALGELQRAAGRLGPVCEIGVWQGRYLTLLSFIGAPDAPIVGIDPFIHVADRDRQIASMLHNLASYAASPERARILERSSTAVTAEELLAIGGPFQFISVDGDHTMRGCLHDLHLAQQVVAPGGIVAVDDICNMSCPGVVEATVRYGVTPGATLKPFAIVGNKLFMTDQAHCAEYRSALLARARAGALGEASRSIADFSARMESLGVPVEMLDEPVLVAA
ncbi:MAG: class I SAM-dependent methyltransferase [Vicinamibacterales bacterium]